MSGGIALRARMKPPIQRRCDVVRVDGAAAGLLTRHRAFEQHRHRRRPAKQLVDRDHGGDGTCAAAPNPARQRQALVNRQRDPASGFEALQQRQHRRRRGIFPRIHRQPSIVAVDGGNRDARSLLRGRDHHIAGFFEGEPHDVESAGDVRHRSGSVGGNHSGRIGTRTPLPSVLVSFGRSKTLNAGTWDDIATGYIFSRFIRKKCTSILYSSSKR